MTSLQRTDSSNPGFIELVKALDAELAERDGGDHSFYAQFNKIDKIRNVVVAFDDNEAVACGAIKEWQPGILEVKRMYTKPQYRGKGIAGKILSALEKWAVELSCHTCVLETGKKQPEAIALYKKNGYKIIPNYGQYKGVDNSVCFEKKVFNKATTL